MLGYHLTFGAPMFLLLLAGLPELWWFSLRSLVGLGRVRRLVALAARSTVIILLVLALADTQLVKSSDRLTVIYLLDQSASIPEDQRRAMAEYVNAEVKKHRSSERQDRAGVIVFGRDAALEVPPIAGDIRISAQSETRVATDHTDIAAALKLAMAAFGSDSARRVVVVTDGNENLESALEVARDMADAGVGIDIVPVRYPARSDVAVERISIPPDVARGQPFDVPVLLNNSAALSAEDGGIARGHLEIYRRSGDNEKLLARERVELPPGKRVFNFREEIDAPDFYVYEARYIPDDPARDAVLADNRATAFTHVRGQGQVLVIENHENKGAFDALVAGLRHQNLQVVVQPSDQLFTSLAELQPFDAVVLADVPREDFSAAQIKMLARNTEQMGAGLIMLGGPNSFGAGGWAGSEVEDAMPVEFQIKNAKLRPAGALALVIDRSGSMSGEKLALAKAAAIASLDVLADGDYATVVAFDAASHLVAPLSKRSESEAMRSAIDRITADGGTNMYPAIVSASHELAQAENAAVRHMILLTDGMSEGNGYPELVARLRQELNITVSTVGVGPDADEKLLEAMAVAGGGRYYAAKSPQALPRIFQEEARVVARPLIFEHKPEFQPDILYPHAMIKGIDSLPAITGYVLTNKKSSELVEVVAAAPIGPEAATLDNRTILAGWTYGLGKAVAFTTDVGSRWASRWPGWPNYEKFFSQMIRWSMRPLGEQGKFNVATDLADGKVHVVLSALDQNDQFLNFLDMSGSAVGPEMKPIDLRMHQTAPGRYVGEFDCPDPGSYFLMINPGAGMAPVLSGVNVPYSAEYLDREANLGLTSALAKLQPKGAAGPGIAIVDAHGRGLDGLLEFDTFRHDLLPATSSQDIWPLLSLAAACVFFIDILVRRVHFSFAPVGRLISSGYARLLRRRAARAPVSAVLERLQTSKAAVSQQIAHQRRAAKVELAVSASISRDEPDDAAVTTAEPPSQTPPPETYTDRLLKAKNSVWRDRR